MRALPNMKVIVPSDFVEAKAAVKAARTIQGPVYIRMGRPKIPIIHDPGYEFELGKAHVLRKGGDVTILAIGIMVHEALAAAESLAAAGIEAEVINVSTVKPLDEATILASVAKTGRAVTAEEHSIIGGLGGAIAELLAEKAPTPLRRIGIEDLFGLSGEADDLKKHFKLTAEDIHDRSVELVNL